MFNVRATFNICGMQTREIDLTPAIGVLLLAVVVLLIGHNTMIVAG